MSASSYSFVSMMQRFAPIMNPGGAVINLTYMASNRIIPGYGGGMSSAKAVSVGGGVGRACAGLGSALGRLRSSGRGGEGQLSRA